jgi:double-strand break repair protein MRE11
VEDDDFPPQVEESDVSMSSTARGGRKTAAKGKAAAPAKKATTQKTAAAKRGKQATPLVSNVQHLVRIPQLTHSLVQQFADDDEDEEEEEEEFVPRAQRGPNGRAAVPKKAPAATKKAPAKKATTTRATPARQSQLR